MQNGENTMAEDSDFGDMPKEIQDAFSTLNETIEKFPVAWKPTGRFMSAKVARAMLAGVTYE